MMVGDGAPTIKTPTDPYLEKTSHKKMLVEWLKVWALSSNPSTRKTKRVGTFFWFFSVQVL
jgi:hypothetical protein